MKTMRKSCDFSCFGSVFNSATFRSESFHLPEILTGNKPAAFQSRVAKTRVRHI